MPGGTEIKKRDGSPGTELWMVVSPQVGAGTNLSPLQERQCSEPLSQGSSPSLNIENAESK